MQETDFQVGLTISYDNTIGDVQFVSEEYITFCVSEKPATCPNSRHPTVKVCMLVYPHQWKDCHPVVNNNDDAISTLSTYKAQEHRYSDVQ